MILVIMRMNVLSEKRTERSQALRSRPDSIKAERGCQRCDFSQSLEDENRLFLLEEWNALERFKINMKSIYYKVLKGAMNLLREPGEMMFRAVSTRSG
jgi:quinol monooxygenase YgiN